MKNQISIMSMLILSIFIFSEQLFGQLTKTTYIDITEEAGINFRYNFGDYTFDKWLEYIYTKSS